MIKAALALAGATLILAGCATPTAGPTMPPDPVHVTVTSAPAPIAERTPTPTPTETSAPARSYNAATIDIAATLIAPYMAADATNQGLVAVLVCTMLDAGSTPADVDAELAAQNLGTEAPRMYVISISVGALCPAHMDAVTQWVTP